MQPVSIKTKAIRTYLTILLSGLFLILNAQVSISGKLVDAADEPVAFATVTLYQDADQQDIITGDYTDENGAFDLTISETGLLVISYVGGEDFQQEITTLENTDLGTIQMSNSITLEGVEVTAQKAQVTYKNGTLSYMNNGETVAEDGVEFLKNIPMVLADKDDNLLIKGSNAKILINGRDMKMQGEELKAYLKSLTPAQIEKVEVITNPSARHEAAGATGIINIITKEKPQGWFSSIGLSGTYREVFTNRQNASISYFANKIGVSANVVRSDYGYYNILTVDRRLQNAPDAAPIFSENARYDGIGKYYSSKLAINYNISENSTLSAFAKWNNSDRVGDSNGQSSFTENGQARLTNFHNDELDNGNDLTTGINYDVKLDTFGKKLNLDYLYVKSNNDKSSDQISNFFTANELTDDFGLLSLNQSNYEVHSVRADYEQSFGKNGRVEVGLKYSHSLNTSALDYTFDAADSKFILLPIMDNNFRYEENLAAAYVSSDYELNNWSFRAGLRAEYTAFNNELSDRENVQTNSDDYFNLFPNMAATYTTENDNTFSATYSRRLNRPYFRDLNSSIEYSTQYLYQQGNPFLQPEYTNNFELNSKIGSHVISLYATFMNQGISQHVDQDIETNTSLMRTLNFAKNRNIGASYNTSFDVTKSTGVQLNVTGEYQSSELDYKNEITNQSVFSVVVRTSVNQKISEHFKVNWTAYYSTPFLYGAYQVKGQFTNNINIQYQKDNLSISLGMRDIFSAGKWDSQLNTPELSTTWVNRWRTGVVSLGINYSFGNQKAAGKGRYNGKSSSEETNRI